MARAIFLDRDGVINESIVRDGKPHAPRALSEFVLFPGVETAVRKLKSAGFLIFVATNQPDIGNGLVSSEVVEQMHRQLLDTLPITKIYMCPHKQTDGCECRKPKPGMLLKAKEEFGLDMPSSFMVGDRYSDVCAGIAAGCTPVFIDRNYVETPDFDVSIRAHDLFQASMSILKGENHD